MIMNITIYNITWLVNLQITKPLNSLLSSFHFLIYLVFSKDKYTISKRNLRKLTINVKYIKLKHDHQR